MSKEPLSNSKILLDGPLKPDPELAGKEPEWFVGRYVKYGFPYTCAEGEQHVEYMWVMVNGYSGKHFIGILGNDPLLPSDFKEGDSVIIPIDGVVQVWGYIQ